MSPYKIVLSRHGQSQGNKDNRFCGWYDAELTDQGQQEAIRAGKALKNSNYQFDIAFTSLLTRAQHTLQLILNEIGQTDIPVVRTWRLNERHFGILTGQLKKDAEKEHGTQQLARWRGSIDCTPPPMEPGHPHYDDIINDPRYEQGPAPNEFPKTENFRTATNRALIFWNGSIVPEIKAGKRVLVVSHENILKGVIQHLEQMSDERVKLLSLPTAVPFIYTLDDDLKPVGSVEFLGDCEIVKKAKEVIEGK